MSRLVDDALRLAYNAHQGQKRKYTREPYITHPICVAALLSEYGYCEEVIAAGLLHDVVEDTKVTIEDIYAVFGETVGGFVRNVTDISKPEDGNRAQRKAIDRQHIADADIPSQAIKCADLIDNTRSIVQYDKGFAKVYLAEKALILEAIKYKSPIHTEALKVLKAAMEKLGKSESAEDK